MPEYSPMPDAEAVAASALRASNVCGGRVYSSVPARPVWPLAVVQRLGGVPPVKQRLDAARIQVDVWGNSKSEARDASELARRTLLDTEGQAFADFSAYVTGVQDELGLTWFPDPLTGRDRYLFAVVLYCHDYTT